MAAQRPDLRCADPTPHLTSGVQTPPPPDNRTTRTQRPACVRRRQGHVTDLPPLENLPVLDEEGRGRAPQGGFGGGCPSQQRVQETCLDQQRHPGESGQRRWSPSRPGPSSHLSALSAHGQRLSEGALVVPSSRAQVGLRARPQLHRRPPRQLQLLDASLRVCRRPV